MEGKEKTHPDFPEWIKGKQGDECMQWPISEKTYLFNRLFWAFDAGRNCVWDQYIAQKKLIEELIPEVQYLAKLDSQREYDRLTALVEKAKNLLDNRQKEK